MSNYPKVILSLEQLIAETLMEADFYYNHIEEAERESYAEFSDKVKDNLKCEHDIDDADAWISELRGGLRVSYQRTLEHMTHKDATPDDLYSFMYKEMTTLKEERKI